MDRSKHQQATTYRVFRCMLFSHAKGTLFHASPHANGAFYWMEVCGYDKS